MGEIFGDPQMLELAKVFLQNFDERHAFKLVSIVAALRQGKPDATLQDLTELIEDALPATVEKHRKLFLGF